MPSDEQIQAIIERLEGERDEIHAREAGADPDREADVARAEEIRIDLDRLWDLLRRRRALRDAGQDPDDAHEQGAETVEHYWQ